MVNYGIVIDVAATTDIEIYRAERFQELGFSDDEALALADAEGLDGHPLYWGDVKRFLDQGATKKQIVAIYADEAHQVEH